LAENLVSGVGIYIKTDIGYNRTGIRHDDHLTFTRLIQAIKASGKLSLTGFLSHAGHTYKARSFEEIRNIHYESVSRMSELKEYFRKEFPGLIISVGDTPSCSVVNDFQMVDEIRPGNFVFYDYTQILIGSCLPDQVAVVMACPVVATHPERQELVIYGGSIHFAKDSVVNNEGEQVHGIVVTDNENGWEHIINGAYLTKLSQEHGIVKLPGKMAHCFKPGDIIKIIPAHSCTTANLMRDYMTLDGRIISRM
jgi:D-serine deaminase-like pyridoxal phosphate-dependent protein